MKFFTPFTLLFFVVLIQESVAQNCQSSTAQVDLVTPRAQVRHHSSGTLWWDGEADGEFIVNDPTLSAAPVVAVFAANFWAAGTDVGGNLKVAVGTYRVSNGETDWWPGPLNDIGQSPSENCQNFDRIWTMNAVDINAFEADFNDNGAIDDDIHPTILMWPGKDNPLSLSQNGFALPAGRSLAPFIDQNNDGIYNPNDGDLPDIKSAMVAHWWIFNDNGNIHTASNCDALKVDVGVLAYSFDDSPTGVSTFYYEFEITNKGLETIKDMHVGLWMDPDGCSREKIGSLPSENLAFVYNQFVEDSNGGVICNGTNTFQLGTPLFGIKILKGTKDENGEDNRMSSFIYYNRPGQGNSPSATLDPQISADFYQYLQGFWKDGSPITTGGTGFNTGGDITKFAFPDPPNDIDGWSMCTTNLEPADLRMVIGSGPTRLDSGENTRFSFAAILTEKVEHPCPDLSSLVEAGNAAQTTYDRLSSGLSTTITKADFSIFPNPTDQFINIRTKNAAHIQQIELFNISGQFIQTWSKIHSADFQIDINEIVSGMYLMKVVLADGTVGVEKVVVD